MKLLENGSMGLTMREFLDLPNYSCSLPTGTTPGKKWRCAVNFYRQRPSDAWKRGMYGKPYPEGHKYHGQIAIHWLPIVILGQPNAWPRDVKVPLRPLEVAHD